MKGGSSSGGGDGSTSPSSSPASGSGRTGIAVGSTDDGGVMPEMGPDRGRGAVVVRVLMMLLQQISSILLRRRHFQRILDGIGWELLMMMMVMTG